MSTDHIAEINCLQFLFWANETVNERSLHIQGSLITALNNKLGCSGGCQLLLLCWAAGWSWTGAGSIMPGLSAHPSVQGSLGPRQLFVGPCS